MRECDAADYEGPASGRWISLRHVRDKYLGTEWARSHLHKQGERHATLGSSLSPSRAESDLTIMTDSLDISLSEYVYAPYRCKRKALDVAASLEELPSVHHVAYIGDSILRTSFCGHLYPSLHNGSFGGGCTPDDPKSSRHTAKTFDHALQVSNGNRTSVKFSQRFFTGDTSTWAEALQGLGADVLVTHVVLNVGMWFVTLPEEGYMDRVTDALRLVTSTLITNSNSSSAPLRIVWPSTPSVSPGVNCFEAYKRAILKDHGILAQRVLKDFKETDPSVRVDFVDYFRLTDGRPETSTDGRHWAMESDFETVTKMRPLVGSADDAMLEWAWDVWRVRDQEEREGQGDVVWD
ncbi:BQ2448_394 [Microbotryum intermedium]|uniref:BQ2448_394 protein n=1 Tax=Microbotryum intermedium TaxID=269621 RepID=A0A238F8C4_9BASI|nr:BQ2448_394 [Microbotryum intermedium]